MDASLSSEIQDIPYTTLYRGNQQLASRTTATSYRIPREICDLIIDLHHEDRAVLYACSLTCHAWLPRSRYWLFKTVSVYLSSMTKFQNALTNNPALGCFVEHLSIHAWSLYQPLAWDNILQSIAAHLVCLVTLEIFKGYFKDPNSFQAFTTIRTLRLRGTCFDSEATRQAWLLSIPQVQEIDFSDIEPMDSRESTAASFQDLLLPNLHSLKFDKHTPDTSSFMNYVLPDARRRVDLGDVSLEVVGDWLTIIAASLDHLAFPNKSYRGHSNDLLLARCTGLRSLEYSIDCDDADKDTTRLLWALQTIASPSISVIRFNLIAYDRNVYEHKVSISNPPALSALLSSPKFASLERVSFHLSVYGLTAGEPPIFADLKVLLPDLDTRGILTFSMSSRRHPFVFCIYPQEPPGIDEENPLGWEEFLPILAS
ncbi:hypothetical protein CERSUDRAFT_116158 [Gelatoporia subvermispora B]|uniref:F-box domain-containing protein n=1 Tax=Ceriporiopsis subvermispora (strain B) TaxID=914234 RepID=M2R9E9_CERS8|nr:hypothetical protein CERSUDRAFT_116158 [Gelatoporia subvermispora B]